MHEKINFYSIVLIKYFKINSNCRAKKITETIDLKYLIYIQINICIQF
jgi:hypothetical protein